MGKYEKLQSSLENSQLISITLRVVDDFYSGIVHSLDSHWVILQTYNDYGLWDGYVIIRLSQISQISTNDFDLRRLKHRMEIAQDSQLREYDNLTLPDLAIDNLFEQVTSFLIEQKKASMLVTNTTDIYNQVYLKRVSNGGIDFTTIDPFNFCDNKKSHFPMEKLLAIEFGGEQLELASNFFKNKLHHEPTILVRNTEMMPQVLQKYENQLVVIYCDEKDGSFFVGHIQSINADSLFLRVVDNSGLYGGNLLLKIDEISYLSIQNDYLQMLNSYVDLHQQRGNFFQPVLSNQIDIDLGENMWKKAFERLIEEQTIFRFQIRGLDGINLAHCIDCTDTKVKLSVYIDLMANLTEERVYDYQEISVMMWGYLNTYFMKSELLE